MKLSYNTTFSGSSSHLDRLLFEISAVHLWVLLCWLISVCLFMWQRNEIWMLIDSYCVLVMCMWVWPRMLVWLWAFPRFWFAVKCCCGGEAVQCCNLQVRCQFSCLFGFHCECAHSLYVCFNFFTPSKLCFQLFCFFNLFSPISSPLHRAD